MTPRVSQSCPSCALIARAIRCPTDMPAGMRNALHAISGVLCRPQSGFHVLDLNIPRGTQRAFTFSGPRGSGAVRRCESVYLIGVTPCLSSVHPRRRTLSFQPCTPPGVAPPPEESNPCCAHPAYRVALRRLVPQITSLDGERLALVDASGKHTLSYHRFSHPILSASKCEFTHSSKGAPHATLRKALVLWHPNDSIVGPTVARS